MDLKDESQILESAMAEILEPEEIQIIDENEFFHQEQAIYIDPLQAIESNWSRSTRVEKRNYTFCFAGNFVLYLSKIKSL